jgi:hypothetical protein
VNVKKFFKGKWIWLLIAVALVVVVVAWGGKTIVVMNSAFTNICEVHISYNTDPGTWGPNRILGKIVWPNSYDIHMPIYFDWFKPAGQTTVQVWAVDCDGKVINTTQFDAKTGFFDWQVTQIIK